MTIIPWMGLHKKYHGRPTGDGEIRYSDQIVADLVFKAKKNFGLRYLVLFVHPQNAAAIKVYGRNGFEKSDKVLEENEYLGMWMDISSL